MQRIIQIWAKIAKTENKPQSEQPSELPIRLVWEWVFSEKVALDYEKAKQVV